MFQLHLSENLIRLRRERKITQEELADFIGVTKAAVSKWENAQTTPDILLLPRLASFFDVTIDRLLGYEAQLSREQIRRCYMELYQDFANLPFSEVWEKVRSTAHRYYSCYPLLLQLCVLYLNHFMLAVKKETTVLFSTHILSDVEHICDELAFLHEGRTAAAPAFDIYFIRDHESGHRQADTLDDGDYDGTACRIRSRPHRRHRGRHDLLDPILQKYPHGAGSVCPAAQRNIYDGISEGDVNPGGHKRTLPPQDRGGKDDPAAGNLDRPVFSLLRDHLRIQCGFLG